MEAQVHELHTNDEFVLSDVDDTELRVRMQPGIKFAAVETSVLPFLMPPQMLTARLALLALIRATLLDGSGT